MMNIVKEAHMEMTCDPDVCADHHMEDKANSPIWVLQIIILTSYLKWVCMFMEF